GEHVGAGAGDRGEAEPDPDGGALHHDRADQPQVDDADRQLRVLDLGQGGPHVGLGDHDQPPWASSWRRPRWIRPTNSSLAGPRRRQRASTSSQVTAPPSTSQRLASSSKPPGNGQSITYWPVAVSRWAGTGNPSPSHSGTVADIQVW